MRVALVYDRVNKWGGAERILLALHELFPDAPLYTSVYDPNRARWAKIFAIKTSFLQRFSIARRSHELFGLLMPIAFEQFSFADYDLVISVTSEAAKGIITGPRTLHISYCLTPTRYLWSGYKEYFSNPIFRFLAYPAVAYLRIWEKVACARPDLYVAISHEVKKRIKRYYHRGSVVIYPPVSLDEKNSSKRVRKGKYFLIVSRLVKYKRIDIAIKACNELLLPLKIIGVGSQLPFLKRIAGPTVEFLGNLTDEEVVEYYKGCRALIFPGKEDFGLTIVEAQRYGKPVVAFRGGGALETVIDGKTGMFFYPQTIKALSQTLRRFLRRRFKSSECIAQAMAFDKAVFQKSFMEFVVKAMEERK
jgi:glycosyltransferase involved in cell wall biosynthesis